MHWGRGESSTKPSFWDFLGGPVVKTPCFHSRLPLVWFLVREPRSHMPHSVAKKKDSQTLQFPANVYGISYLQFLFFLLCEIITHIFLHRSPFGHIIPHWMLLTLYGWHCSELSDPYYYPHRRFYESRKHFWGIDDIFLIWGYNRRAVETYKAHSTR